ncbi:MAG: hypothetical protein WB791_10180, partial [Waddliaceae bacterium]
KPLAQLVGQSRAHEALSAVGKQLTDQLYILRSGKDALNLSLNPHSACCAGDFFIFLILSGLQNIDW